MSEKHTPHSAKMWQNSSEMGRGEGTQRGGQGRRCPNLPVVEVNAVVVAANCQPGVVWGVLNSTHADALAVAWATSALGLAQRIELCTGHGVPTGHCVPTLWSARRQGKDIASLRRLHPTRMPGFGLTSPSLILIWRSHTNL